ncbi:MAG TPA: HWE histidine kinase domain-containing protein [Sphingomicrobium sp.]
MTRLDFIKKRLAAPPPRGASAILYAGFCVAAPTVVRGVVDPVVSATTFSTYYPFVILAGLFLSWQSAIGVAAASAIAGDYLFVEPRFTFFPTPQERFAAAIFVVSAALIIVVGNTLRRTVAELEKARTHEAHLNSELQHRVRNTLAVVHALVRQTFRETPGAKAEVDKLHGRLGALAEANEILRRGRWEGCVLPELAERALEPFNGRAAIKLVGPECRLPEESCVPLVLALHELATNAVKYGALSTGEGSVELSWALSRTIEGQTQLRMSWVERGGPAVSAPTRRGLGSRLLQPKGGLTAVGVNFHPGGVAAAIVVDGASDIVA